MPRITVDEEFIRAVQQRLTAIRNQMTAVRAGVNPNDSGHPHGMPWADLKVLAGSGTGGSGAEGPSFAPGVNLATRVSAVGKLVDGKVVKGHGQLGTYAQGLGNIVRSTDSLEQANESAASFGSFLPGSGAAPPPVPPTG